MCRFSRRHGIAIGEHHLPWPCWLRVTVCVSAFDSLRQYLCPCLNRPCPQPRRSPSFADDGPSTTEVGTTETVIGVPWPVGLSEPWRGEDGKVKPSVPDCCLWYGIYCEDPTAAGDWGEAGASVHTAPRVQRRGVVSSVDLADNGLAGTLPQVCDCMHARACAHRRKRSGRNLAKGLRSRARAHTHTHTQTNVRTHAHTRTNCMSVCVYGCARAYRTWADCRSLRPWTCRKTISRGYVS